MDTAASRAIAFSALFNFRDVGGYVGLDGRRVRPGRLYRSDSLHRLADLDRETFTGLNIRTVVDLRRPYEVAQDGRVPAYENLVYVHIHPEHREWDETPYEETHTPARYLADRYRDLAETGAAGLAAAVGVIADEEAAPVVVHCAAGKDRTGVVCALTLSLIGVDDVDIVADYALSTPATERYSAWLLSQGITEVPPFYSSPAEAMLLFLTELRQRHGSVERFLLESGLERSQIVALRAHLLD